MLDAKNICIIRLGALGDVINTLPALESVRAAAPGAHIAWVVEPPSRDVLPPPPTLDEVILLPKNAWRSKCRRLAGLLSLPGEMRAFTRGLRARNFDLVLDFHGNLRSGLVARATRAPVRVGYARGFCREWNYLFTNRRFAVGGERTHRIDRALALAEAAGAPRACDTPKVVLSDEALAFALDTFVRNDLVPHPVVAVHPGTSRFGSYKRWPAERYREVIRLLDAHGYRSLVTWGPGEAELAESAACDTNAVISPQTASVAQLAALLCLCDAFIGSDSGPAILAAAVDTPPVVLFGPKDPAVYAPRHPRTRVVEVPLDCRPCKRRRCDDPRCILHITVQHVADAAFALLDEMEGN